MINTVVPETKVPSHQGHDARTVIPVVSDTRSRHDAAILTERGGQQAAESTGQNQRVAAGSPRSDGRALLGVSWAAAAVLHARNLVAAHPTATMKLLDGVLVLVALVGVALLLGRAGPRVLLFAAVAGAVGVASWFVPLMVDPTAVLRLDPWVFGAVLLDALTVRLAVFNMHRNSRGRDGG